MGWTSILVRTGCFQGPGDNDPRHPATHVCPSITGTSSRRAAVADSD
jgi:hypothetical protein